jgi:hypothetical protein
VSLGDSVLFSRLFTADSTCVSMSLGSDTLILRPPSKDRQPGWLRRFWRWLW